METADVRRLVIAAERIANGLERIATAIEAHNAADPLQLIQDALAMEANKPVNLDGQLPSVESVNGFATGVNAPKIDPDDWRRR